MNEISKFCFMCRSFTDNKGDCEGMYNSDESCKDFKLITNDQNVKGNYFIDAFFNEEDDNANVPEFREEWHNLTHKEAVRTSIILVEDCGYFSAQVWNNENGRGVFYHKKKV